MFVDLFPVKRCSFGDLRFFRMSDGSVVVEAREKLKVRTRLLRFVMSDGLWDGIVEQLGSGGVATEAQEKALEEIRRVDYAD